MTLKLRVDWRQAWRWFSMQAMALDAALLGAWGILPDDLKAYVPHGWVAIFAVTILVLGMIGRVVQQNPPAAKTELGK